MQSQRGDARTTGARRTDVNDSGRALHVNLGAMLVRLRPSGDVEGGATMVAARSHAMQDHGMLRGRAWDVLRRATPPALRRTLKNRRWFTPLASILFGNAVYSRGYYQDIERLEAQSAPRIAEWIASNLAPRSIIDVGCGSGLLMDALRQHGIDVRGVDRSPEGARCARARGLWVDIVDLTENRPLAGGPYDVAISCEVAEHLEARHARAFVDRLTEAAPTIFFTAAEPDPAIGPGLYHFNEQPNAYWIDLMRARGYRLDRDATDRVRAALAGPEVVEYLRRPMIFRRDT